MPILYDCFEAPDPGAEGQVYFHHPLTDAAGQVTAAITNRALGFGAYVRYRAAELPALTEWKMMGAGTYVCALEPATNHEAPRPLLRERGLLRHLEPGEEVSYWLELGARLD